MSTTLALSKKRKSKWTFTLRFLLTVVTAIAILFAFVGNYWRLCHAQLEHIREIERENGSVKCVGQPSGWRKILPSVAKQFLPQKAVDRPQSVYFPENQVLDERLASHIAALDGVESVWIDGGSVSKTALSTICRMATLRSLGVMVDGLDRDDCAILSRATQVDVLQVRGKSLTRDDCATLARSSHLYLLEIVECPLEQSDIDRITRASKIGLISIERPQE